MAEIKKFAGMIFGEISLLGQPANKSMPAKFVILVMNT